MSPSPLARRARRGQIVLLAVLFTLTFSGAVPGAVASSGVSDVAGVGTLGANAAPGDRAWASTFASAQREAQRRAGRYSPQPGVLTNDPRYPSRRRIIHHIIESIKSVRSGGFIRVASWNVASPIFVREMLNANARGVTVRLLTSKAKVMEQPPYGDFWRLRRGLRQLSREHPQAKGRHSWARFCDRSCRGRRGIAHSKYFLFSKAGRSEDVVISTSANATEVSANSQWNDAFTLVGRPAIYHAFVDIFKQSSNDRRVLPGYVTTKSGTVEAYFYPWTGAWAKGDRAGAELRRITCRGTRGGTGVNGRTRIRIAQDAIIDKRGQRLAYQLRALYQQGCNIKIVYSLMNRRAHEILSHSTRGPIPMRQIVQDFDGDGIYDRYLHAKVMTLSGRYRHQRAARIAWQGSENWSGLAQLSDEQGFKLFRPATERHYVRWIDNLFAYPPIRTPYRTLARPRPGVDPYRKIRANLG